MLIDQKSPNKIIKTDMYLVLTECAIYSLFLIKTLSNCSHLYLFFLNLFYFFFRKLTDG